MAHNPESNKMNRIKKKRNINYHYDVTREGSGTGRGEGEPVEEVEPKDELSATPCEASSMYSSALSLSESELYTKRCALGSMAGALTENGQR